MSARMKRTLQIVAGVLVALVILAGVAVAGAMAYAYYKSWEIDYQNHKAMVQIIQYNIQQGKLLQLPQPQPPAAPVGVPPSTPEKK